jgi:hypothetical protein
MEFDNGKQRCRRISVSSQWLSIVHYEIPHHVSNVLHYLIPSNESIGVTNVGLGILLGINTTYNII